MKIEDIEKISGSFPLKEYENSIVETDRFYADDVTPILLGLYGEVGSIMTTSKKYRREKKAYPGYKEAVEEEFGDALWYFAALCRRFDFKLADMFESAVDNLYSTVISANDQESAPISKLMVSIQEINLDEALKDLGVMAAKLLETDKESPELEAALVSFAKAYLFAIQAIKIPFSRVVKSNLMKTFGRFSDPERSSLPDFDKDFPQEEQLPRYFEIHITQRPTGQCYLSWNGVVIGSPLTDNIGDSDGYRFHDVFHFAFAAILHWSPTFRALIKHKRKSDPVFDEAQDSGRAIVVEEGLAAWLYSYSKGLDYFEGHNGVSFDVLKTIQKFIHGYEVERCPLKLWEDAIIQGYSVFREVKRNNGGIIIGNRETRTLQYKSLEKKDDRK